MEVASSFLEVENLCCGYGALEVIKGISLEVPLGRGVAVVGQNASGKSTLLRCLAGLVPMKAGKISMAGVDLKGEGAPERVRRGLVLVPQVENVFANLTLEENLFFTGALRRPRRMSREVVEEVLRMFPTLRHCRGRAVATLSSGERQLVAVSQALVMKPKYLLLDEPFAGVAPGVGDRLERVLKARVRKGKMGLLIAEQDLLRAKALADILLVMRGGRVVRAATNEISVEELRGALVCDTVG